MGSAAAAELDGPVARDLIARLAALPGWIARAGLAVMAQLLPDPSDRQLAELELRTRDEPLPGWAERFDEVAVSAAVRLEDPLGDADLLHLELQWPESEPLVIVLLIDHNLGSTIKAAALLSRSIDSFVDLFAAQGEEPLAQTTLTLPDARAAVESAMWPLRAVEMLHEAPPGDLRPLVEWLIARLPAGGSMPERSSTTEADRKAMRDRFFESPWGRALDRPGRDHVVDALLELAADGDDPLRWSRARVGHLDLHALADDPWFDPEDLAAVPDLLRALIGFAHEERRIPRHHTDAAMAAVEHVSAFLRAGARDWHDPWMPTPYREDEPLDRLAAQVGSRATLKALDETPLPDEPFQRDGILPEVLPAAEALLPVVDDLCDRFFDVELRTAARRLLAAIARRSGSVVRRGRTDTTAAGIVWLVATANRSFDRHGVRHKDLAAHLGLSSALSSRADSLRRALTDGRERRSNELGDAGLLTGARRSEIMQERDLLLEDEREQDRISFEPAPPRLRSVDPSNHEDDHDHR